MLVAATSGLTTALLSAAAAILGAAVGGAVTGVVTLKAERSRQEHAVRLEDERERRRVKAEQRLALGAARNLQAFFLQAAVLLRIHARDKRWWSDAIDLTPPSPQDRSAVLAVLGPDEWRRVSVGLYAIDNVLMQRANARRAGVSDLDIPFVGRDPDGLVDAADLLEDAADALKLFVSS